MLFYHLSTIGFRQKIGWIICVHHFRSDKRDSFPPLLIGSHEICSCSNIIENKALFFSCRRFLLESEVALHAAGSLFLSLSLSLVTWGKRMKYEKKMALLLSLISRWNILPLNYSDHTIHSTPDLIPPVETATSSALSILTN